MSDFGPWVEGRTDESETLLTPFDMWWLLDRREYGLKASSELLSETGQICTIFERLATPEFIILAILCTVPLLITILIEMNDPEPANDQESLDSESTARSVNRPRQNNLGEIWHSTENEISLVVDCRSWRLPNPSESPRYEQLSNVYREHVVPRCSSLTIALVALGIFLFTFSIFQQASTGSNKILNQSPTDSTKSHTTVFASFYRSGSAGPGVFPLKLADKLPSDICSICECRASPAFYNPSTTFANTFSPRPLLTDLLHNSQATMDINEVVRQILLDIYCASQFLTARQALTLLLRAGTHLEEMMSWSLQSLDRGRPTMYLTTATSPVGKAGPMRQQYFRRHGRAIQSWIRQQKESTSGNVWQIIWVVAEDEVQIDPRVTQTLRNMGIPYVYFAYGLTNLWGNPQKNAVLQLVYGLSRSFPKGLYGHGPVYGLDDDNKIRPELLGLLTNVRRIGVLPVGNLGSGWESPILDDQGKVVGSDSPWRRKFPFDFGGLAINSSLLGSAISGPSFWKHPGHAGEAEFIDQVASSNNDLESLCGRMKLDDCHFVWHNEPLTEVERMSDEEELAYIQEHRPENMFQAES